jgi:uncharacterized protein
MATVQTRAFQLEGADGGPLRGSVRTVGDGGGRPAVVICHGFKGFKEWGFFPPLAHRIANAGVTTVSFNFSGSGIGPDGESFSEGERFARATFSGDVEDIRRVCAALTAGDIAGTTPPGTIGMFGHSRGGGTAILYAARYGGLAALVTWNAIASVHQWTDEEVESWRASGKMDVVNARTGDVLPVYTDVLDDIEQNGEDSLHIAAAAERIGIPWLIVHGDADEAVSVADGRHLYANSGSEAKLQIVKGGAHTLGAKHPWSGATPELEQAMDITSAWFSRHLK